MVIKNISPLSSPVRLISESANIDPENFSWLVYKGNKKSLKGHNQRHTLVLEKEDIYGVRFTKTKTYQLVKADALHVIFRNIDKKKHDNILKVSTPYKGPTPTDDEVTEGFVRNRRVPTKENSVANKQKDNYFRPRYKINEYGSIDHGDYQWRKVSDRIQITTKKQGKSKGFLPVGSIVGVRYLTPARGGYILMDVNKRVLISHELYSHIVNSSKILPKQQQRTGVYDVQTGARDIGRNKKNNTTEISDKKEGSSKVKRRKSKTPTSDIDYSEIDPDESIQDNAEELYNLDTDAEDVGNRVKVRRKRDSVKSRKNIRKFIDEIEKWKEDEDEEDFETEEEDANKAERATSPEEQPEGEPEEGEEGEPEESEETESEDPESEQEENEESEEGEEVEEEEEGTNEGQESIVDVLEPGITFQMKSGQQRKFVIVDAEPMRSNPNLMEYTLYDPDLDDREDELVLNRLRLNISTKMEQFKQNATIIDNILSEEELKKLQSSADFAEIKPFSLMK